MALNPEQKAALEDLEQIEAAIVATRRKLDRESDRAWEVGNANKASDLLDERRRLLPELARIQAAKRSVLRGASLSAGIASLNGLARRARRVKRRLDSLSDALDALRILIEIGRVLGGIIPA